MTADDLIAFESDIRSEWERGELPCLLHLCGGNEDQLIRIFADVKPGDWVFSTHRNHYHALLSGVPSEYVKSRIMEGNSMFIFWNPTRHSSLATCHFYSSAILAGTCCIAAGVAWDIAAQHREDLNDYWSEPASFTGRKQLTHATRPFPWVWCFLGDGAMENGHFAEAIQWAAWNRLPLTFIIEDNDRQVDTPKRARRGYFSDDWQHQVVWPSAHLRHYTYVPTYPHAGSGAKPGTIKFQPAAIERLKQTLNA